MSTASEAQSEAHGHQHRDVSGGWLRPAVFGAMDGLVTNVSLIAGVGGGGGSHQFIVLTGLAGLAVPQCQYNAFTCRHCRADPDRRGDRFAGPTLPQASGDDRRRRARLCRAAGLPPPAGLLAAIQAESHRPCTHPGAR